MELDLEHLHGSHLEYNQIAIENKLILLIIYESTDYEYAKNVYTHKKKTGKGTGTTLLVRLPGD